MKPHKPRKNLTLKPKFTERMQQLLPDKSDYQSYLNILKIPPVKSIRCNTLKISPDKLKKKLKEKGWKIKQPWKDYPEVMIVEGKTPFATSVGGNERSRRSEIRGDSKRTGGFFLEPGELGRALEHLLGYYYIQELASMLPIIALKPLPDEMILDLCSAPGSKTTQTASEIENSGTIIANEVSIGRLKILASNLERCGVTNTIITKKDGIALCKKIAKDMRLPSEAMKEVAVQGLEESRRKPAGCLQFDRILVDAPCSGEGTLRSSPKTYLMWNPKTIKTLSRLQIRLVESALEILKPNGILIYSTCTHAPEENEEVVDNILKNNLNIKLEKVKLPIKHREGITRWKDKEFSKEIKKCARIYPHDANTDGFFVAKFRKLE